MLYFDNASTSFPKPENVSQAVANAINTMGNPSRGAYNISLVASRLVYDTRLMISEFFNAPSPLHIAFTSNVTESLNTIISTVISEKDNVITTCWEHNSVLRPLYNRGCSISIVPMDEKGNLIYSYFEKMLCENTKAVICNHGSNVTGNIADINFIHNFCRKHNLLFILDVAQTAGFLPIDMEHNQVDVICFTGHKSLLGPQGTGGIILNKDINFKLKPFKVGGSGSHSFDKLHPTTMPDCFEAGTLNAHGLAGLKAGLEHIYNEGLHNIREKEQHFAKNFYEGIKNIEGIRFYGDYETENRCPIVSFNIKDYDSNAISEELYERYSICTRAGAHCAPLIHKSFGTEEQGIVRFSFSSFLTMADIEVAINAVHSLT